MIKLNYFPKLSFLKFSMIFLMSLFLGSAIAQSVYYPNKIWKAKSASDVGFDENIIANVVEFAEQNEYSGAKDLRIAIYEGFKREPFIDILGPTKHRGGPAGMIVKNGYIIAQWGDIERVDMTFSVTKSYLSTTFGLALDYKLITDVNDKVNSYVWNNTFKGRHNSKIQWNHLLNQSSDWSGTLFGQHDWADRPPSTGDIDDWRYRELQEPGTVYEYNDVRVNVLAYSLLQVWRKPLPQVLKEKIMDPIGASSTWRWNGYENSWVTIDGLSVQSVSGGGHSGGGMFINTIDQARFGYLFLRNGNWNGKQLISEEWVSAVQQPSKANMSYGYMWWLNKGNRKMEGVPEHVFYGAGFGGNYVVIDQENDLLIVTRWLEPSKLGEFLKQVYSALD
ncbi:MAG: serine hydrolase [Bacteroidales bacterium]|jgi:CubicO group peptidase (beta-lactamase class C family)|nr:serine hydrolase [Bacteroidales bacterium]